MLSLQHRLPGRLAWLGAGLGAALGASSSLAIDRGADGHFEERRSLHFRLRQDVDIDHVTGRDGSRRFERDVIEVLETAYERVRRSLDIRPRRSIEVRIYDPQLFDGAYAARFRFRTAGFYDGVIHVRGGVRVDDGLTRTLHHEYFHAALDAVTPAGRIPAWLNEGLAEWFENLAIGKVRLGRHEYAILAHASRTGTWLPLATLSRVTFAGLDADTATVAYVQSYAMVEHLVRKRGERRLRGFMRRIVRGGNVERLLKREMRVTLDELDRDLRAEYR